MSMMTRLSPSLIRLIAGPCLALTMAATLTACASTEETPYVERPVETIYSEAAAAMDQERYKEAARLFDEVERQHPYSQWATRAQLMSAYAYYMKGLCYYEQITDVGRDQRVTQQALDALGELTRRFPESPYSRDAALKIDLTNDHLAGKEMEIGRYYLRQGYQNAAIGRFRTVIEKYQTTSHVPEALHRLTEAYLALGVVDEAQAAAAVLGHNFPGSEWYVDSYALLVDANVRPESSSKSWISRAWASVF